MIDRLKEMYPDAQCALKRPAPADQLAEDRPQRALRQGPLAGGQRVGDDLLLPGRRPDPEALLLLDLADLRQAQEIAVKMDAVPILRVAHRIVATLALKPGIARVFARFDTAKECLIGKLDSHLDVLQDLRVNQLEPRLCLLPAGQ